jgi:hypothetical protein
MCEFKNGPSALDPFGHDDVVQYLNRQTAVFLAIVPALQQS